jgi:hypothetical protein
LQPIQTGEVQACLQQFCGQPVYIHLEATTGSYAEGSFGTSTAGTFTAFIRNAAVRFGRAVITGTGPYRVGLQMEAGWVFAGGLTDWELDAEGRLLLAGHNDAGMLTVALEISLTPFPM